MLKVALVEDDTTTSELFRGWISSVVPPETKIDQFFTRDTAVAAMTSEHYDLVVLDIELGREKNAGVAVINVINQHYKTPVLVVSASVAEIYRGVMRALAAWDYLEKPVTEAVFVETFLDMLRVIPQRQEAAIAEAKGDSLVLDNLMWKSTWKGQKLNLPLAAQRILNVIYAKRNEPDPTVTWDVLFQAVVSGKNKENVRRHVATIREALNDVKAGDPIETVPMRGYRWQEPSGRSSK